MNSQATYEITTLTHEANSRNNGEWTEFLVTILYTDQLGSNDEVVKTFTDIVEAAQYTQSDEFKARLAEY